MKKGDVSEADEELLCKPTVSVDLPVWYLEQVAQGVSSSSEFLHQRSRKVSWFLRFIISF